MFAVPTGRSGAARLVVIKSHQRLCHQQLVILQPFVKINAPHRAQWERLACAFSPPHPRSISHRQIGGRKQTPAWPAALTKKDVSIVTLPLKTSAGIMLPSSASITCCHVFVELGITKPKSNSHSSMHCSRAAQKGRTSGRPSSHLSCQECVAQPWKAQTGSHTAGRLLGGRRARTCPWRNTRCSSLNLSISSTEENVSSRDTALQESIDAGTCTAHATKNRERSAESTAAVEVQWYRNEQRWWWWWWWWRWWWWWWRRRQQRRRQQRPLPSISCANVVRSLCGAHNRVTIS